MKKFTKVLAAFCAMAMVFGTFSATVFADETDTAKEDVSKEQTVAAADLPEANNKYENPVQGNVPVAAADNGDAVAAPASADDGQDAGAQAGADVPAGVPASVQPDDALSAGGDQAADDKAPADSNPDDDKKSDEKAPSDKKDDDKKVDEKASADQKEDTKKADDTEAAMAKNGAAEGEDAGSEPVTQPDNNPEEPSQANLFANGVITQSDINSNGYKMPETAGSYTLSQDITVPNSAHVKAAGTEISIDLNGHTITYSGTENLYTLGFVEDVVVDGKTMVLVHGDIVLTIKDTGNGGLIKASGTTKGSDDHWISINGSYPSHGTESYKRGGCILVQNSCTFILEGGTISGFHSESDGGAVHISNGGHCVMTGGRITDCHSDSVRPNDDGAGAISCHCTSKGTSIGNTLYKSSEDQEAVLTTISLKGSLKITGGKIDNCSGKQGGAVRILRGDFEMTGGTIEDNTGLNGGGVLYNRNNKGTFKISGNVVISGNHTTSNDAQKANVYIFDGSTITLNGNLDSTAKIEFGTSAVTSNVFNTAGKSYSIDSFVCNHAGYVVYASGNNIKIKQPEPEIAGYSLVVGGDIRLRAALNLRSFDKSGTSVTYAYSYTKGSNTVNVEKTVNYSDFGTSGSYKTVDIPVESACITSPITITINYGTDGHVSDDPVTIDRYVTAIMNGNYSDKVKAVAYSIRVFGSFAMMQFNINMNDTSLQPAKEEINASLYDPQIVIYQKYLIGEGAAYTPENDLEGAFYGASVNFLSKTEVNLYFKKSVLGTTAPTMTVTYSDNSTETISATENGSYYVYTVKGPTGDGFAATLFDVPFSFSVGNVSGEYSVNTYLQVVEYKYHGSSTNILLKLVEAYYDFARKCQQL